MPKWEFDVTFCFISWEGKKYDIKTFPTDRVLNQETIVCKYNAENVHKKLASESFLILINNPKQPLHGRNSFKNKYILRKKVNFIFEK